MEGCVNNYQNYRQNTCGNWQNEYKRLVSYIYSYPGGCRDRNVGFAKAEVRNGIFSLGVTLCGVYRDAPEGFGIYLLFDRTKEQQTYDMLPVGTVIVNCGKGKFQGIFNPSNIESSAYNFNEIKGIAVLTEKDNYYMCFSLWEADDINPSKCVYLPKGYKRKMCDSTLEAAEAADVARVSGVAETTDVMKASGVAQATDVMKETEVKEAPEEVNVVDEMKAENVTDTEKVSGADEPAEIKKVSAGKKSQDNIKATDVKKPEDIRNVSDAERLFIHADYINAFDDDYYYDCIEVTPEMLKRFIDSDVIGNNSFMMHSYYTYRHLLFGRVAENDNGTRYFIGVPGMYSNKDRYLATMFGFNNFKKSHRSDYPNPYFGYWYTEI